MKAIMSQVKRHTPKLLMTAILLFPLLAGCEQGKQSAVVSIDEAKLVIASARKAKADVYASQVLSSAEGTLRQAEEQFKKGSFLKAKQEAEKATLLAGKAESEARRQASEKKMKKRTKKG